MAEDKFVIIGSGPAGLSAALTLRQSLADAAVTVITKDVSPPYRPHLLPKIISGEVEEKDIYPCSSNFWNEHRIFLRRAQEVKTIDFDKNFLLLEHRETLKFDGLIIAVGGTPRVPERLGSFRQILWTLKTFKDAKSWRQYVAKVESVLIIGGDLTSLAVTRALLSLGKQVTFAITREALWPLRYDADVVEELSRRLQVRGARTIFFDNFKGISRRPEGDYEVTVSGETLRVGMIGAFFGLVPDVAFLTRSGLTIDRGILVDEYLNTGLENVYAAGDCAQIYHPQIKDYWVSIGFDNAVALGRIAALNLVGCSVKAETSAESIFDRDDVNVNTSWWLSF